MLGKDVNLGGRGQVNYNLNPEDSITVYLFFSLAKGKL
jgi:hypothetical protein